jgi:hypothetical protein
VTKNNIGYFVMKNFKIDFIGGNCPVQAEGVIDGQDFYFRARGSKWSMSIGGRDIILNPKWYYEEPYREEGSFDAGWMTESEAFGFICFAIEMFRNQKT